jgi:hypothetical protein
VIHYHGTPISPIKAIQTMAAKTFVFLMPGQMICKDAYKLGNL